MLPKIIVTDPDQGFGLMLAQMLERDGEYVVAYAPNGAQALKLARESQPQLVIIDAALTDMAPPALIRSLRQQSPELRIMLIPLAGSLPPEYVELDVQGILPKPFFVGDLPGCIAGAMAGALAPVRTLTAAANPVVSLPLPTLSPRVQPMTQTPRAPRRSAAPAAPLRELPSAGIDALLNALAGEISAEALFVIKDGAVVTQRSNMNDLRRESMSELLAAWFKVAGGIATFVGERGGRFKQLHFEGERYHIYGFGIGDSAILVAICRSEVPFGNLRLSIKNAVPAIARLLQ